LPIEHCRLPIDCRLGSPSRRCGRWLAWLVVLAAISSVPGPAGPGLLRAGLLFAQGYDTVALEQFRASHEASLKADNGWLTVAGLHFLNEGENSVGRAPTNDIVLDFPGVPDAGAIVVLAGGNTRIKAPAGRTVLVNNQPVREGPLQRSGQGKPADIVSFGRVTFFVHYSGPRLALRVRNLDSPLRTKFAGLKWFRPNPAFRVKATFNPYPAARVASLPNILGDLEPFTVVGSVSFALGGVNHEMVAWRSGQRLWFVFRDLTSGKETNTASRFLYQAVPAPGEFMLDFNYAQNPPCGYNPYTTCPLPPPQNRLPVRVEAGELRYGN
jgi:uncharacterized protein (DUF1684 family)